MPKVVPGYKDQARARIVAGALAAFRRKGLSRTTMDDIAREVGVSKGALYLYFRSKTELFAAIQARFRDQVLRRWEGLVERGDVAVEIARVLDTVREELPDVAVWHTLLADASDDPDVREALRLDHRDDVRHMQRFLVRLRGAGRIPPLDDANLIAEIVMMLLHGAMIQASFVGSPAEARRRLVRALRKVLNLPVPARARG